MVPIVDDVLPFEDWPTAVRSTLALLHRTIGLDVWLVTRVEGDEQVVLYAHPPEAVEVGTVLSWDRSFCRKMVAGAGPRISTVTAATPAYAHLRTGPIERVAAYVGVPLVTRDGELFGTLCGLSTRAQPRSLARQQAMVEMTARMLSTVLALTGGPRHSDGEPAARG